MKKCIRYFAVSVIMCMLLLFTVDSIPQSAVKKQIVVSADYFSKQPLFGYLRENRNYTIYDNYADAIITNIIYFMDSTNPVMSSIKASYYGENMVEVNESLLQATRQELEPNIDYFRYWHGSMVYLRPLYMFFSITGVRLALFSILFGLMAVTSILLYRAGFRAPAVILPLSMLLLQIWMCSFSVEYIHSFLVMQVFLLAIAMRVKKTGSLEEKEFLPWFAVSGVVTCFVDFLTTETVTFTMPLLLIYMMRKEKGCFGKFRQEMVFGLQSMIAWGISYATMFLLKWGISACFLGKEAFQSAFFEATVRVAGEVTDNNTNIGKVLSTGEQLSAALWKNLQALFTLPLSVNGGSVFGISFAVMLLLFTVWYLFRRKESTGAFQGVILLLGLIPYIRFLTLRNHSYIHCFFTYRAQVVTVAVLIAFLWYGLRGDGRAKR